MPRKDTFHETVKNALVKDGWTITHDPYPLKFGEEDLQIDLGAEAPVGAEKRGDASLSRSRVSWGGHL